MIRIVVLISGNGRNLQAIVDACNQGQIKGKVVAVISNREDAFGLHRARQAGVNTHTITRISGETRQAYDHRLDAAITPYNPDLIVLAGFMRVLSSEFVHSYTGKLINIHPSLLPKYRGLHTHRRVLEAGDKTHGASVHFVSEELDGGPVILQGHISVQDDDNEDSLAQRVMNAVELTIYPIAISWIADGRIRLVNNQVWMDGNQLTAPMLWPEQTQESGISQ